MAQVSWKYESTQKWASDLVTFSAIDVSMELPPERVTLFNHSWFAGIGWVYLQLTTVADQCV